MVLNVIYVANIYGYPFVVNIPAQSGSSYGTSYYVWFTFSHQVATKSALFHTFEPLHYKKLCKLTNQNTIRAVVEDSDQLVDE